MQMQTRMLKQVPNLTAYSKEALYEDAMRAKLHMNDLRDENRAARTKLHFVESQLA
jgi:hypothetical protein